jgi:hypothetical protein
MLLSHHIGMSVRMGRKDMLSAGGRAAACGLVLAAHGIYWDSLL